MSKQSQRHYFTSLTLFVQLPNHRAAKCSSNCRNKRVNIWSWLHLLRYVHLAGGSVVSFQEQTKAFLCVFKRFMMLSPAMRPQMPGLPAALSVYLRCIEIYGCRKKLNIVVGGAFLIWQLQLHLRQYSTVRSSWVFVAVEENFHWNNQPLSRGALHPRRFGVGQWTFSRAVETP